MPVITLIPAATEILYALNAYNLIVGRSSESDFPSKIKKIPVVVTSKINSSYSSKYIDETVSKALKRGESLYKVNSGLFASLKPDLVITQKLCEVCAITPTDIQSAIRNCHPTPKIISLHPHSISDILKDIKTLGKAVGEKDTARKYVEILLKRIETIKNKTKAIKKRPKVYCMEWLDPPYNGGHWVPQQVEIAGGRDDLATRGKDSTRILWQKIAKYNPDFLILMPCGFSINRTLKELPQIFQKFAIAKKWYKLKAVQNGQVFVVNGPAFFNCSGPRVVDGIELLAHILHPELFPDRFTKDDFVKFSS